ncbi:flavin reductase family protein [Mycolicibacterium lutetiense]
MAGVVTPVAVVTVFDGDRPHGTTVSAFMSLSLEPPMVMVALDKASNLLRAVQAVGQFGINVLGTSQAAWARTFADKRVTDRFADVKWNLHSGIPRLVDTRGWLACSVHQTVSAGDHIAVLAHVDDAAAGEADPLTYYARLFGTHRPLDRC